ncbi:uncharacterized protein LOC132269659 [Cornus florida]|uniref:uncharacterized protein LOC132269659 n=1 Tax=Cornus florida TaxID=4283 RepID=UPI00289C5793|nr:uncharacterized protein LOC132269659 [Cornus florida]
MAGSLALFYYSGLDVQVFDYSDFQVSCVVDAGFPGRSWAFSVVYASRDDSIRASQWRYLQRLQPSLCSRWLLLGDFKRYASSSGETRRFKGFPYTWCNQREYHNTIWTQIDRGLCSQDWLRVFPHYSLLHLPVSGSNHAALLLDLNVQVNSSSRQFFFDARWLKFPEYSTVIKDSWAFPCQGSNLFRLKEKLKACKANLKCWNRGRNHNSSQRIQQLQTQLASLKSSDNLFDRSEIFWLEKELADELHNEEIFWK